MQKRNFSDFFFTGFRSAEFCEQQKQMNMGTQGPWVRVDAFDFTGMVFLIALKTFQ